jgi:homoserine kinase type II
MLALDDAGLPVPVPLSDRYGHLDLVVQGKSALLQRRLPGDHVLVPTGNQLAALGRLVARLHLAAKPLADRVPAHPRNVDWLNRATDSLRGLISYDTTATVETSIAVIASVLGREDVQSLPAGVVHGDIFRDNVLFEDESLTGIIDFHHAARGKLIYDLAVIANDWCCDRNGHLNPEKILALLKGYHGLRPLTRQEIWFFSPFRLFAATSFWLSRLVAYVQSSRSPGTRTKNPREMERIVRVLLSGFDYFDERVFDPTAG